MVGKTSIVKTEGLNFQFKAESITSESTCFLPALMFLPRTSDNQSHQDKYLEWIAIKAERKRI